MSSTAPYSHWQTDSLNSSSATSNISDAERQKYLNELQADTTITMIPAMIFLSLLAVVGLVGNSLVMFVYSCRFKRSATRILIITIAVLDLVANVLAIPGDIYDMFHIWDFENPNFCRIRLFFSAFTTLSSAMALLAIAIVRYRKVCKPYNWQITIVKARVISIVVTALGIIFSIPYAIISGRLTKKTPRDDIMAHECTTDDSYVNTSWPIMNYGFFLLLYISCSGVLVVLYILIGVKAWQHRKIHGSSSPEPCDTRPVIASNPSSDVNRSRESEDKDFSTASGSVKDVTHAKSTDTSEVASSHGEEAENPAGEILEHLEQYTVHIFNDRVEIRTPMMGEIIVSLQKPLSSMADVIDHNGVIDNSTTNHMYINNMYDFDQEAHCEFPSRGEADEHSSRGLSKSNQDIVGRSEVSLNSVHISSLISLTERTDQRTKISNSEIKGRLNGSQEMCPKSPTVSEHPLEETDKHSLHSLASELSQLSCDLDPVAALKWVDIVYSRDDGQTTNLESIKPETKVSYRISQNSQLLQKTDWLRNIIADALSKASSKSKRPDEVGDPGKFGNMELNTLKSENTECRTGKQECRNGDHSGNSNSLPKADRSILNRLRDFVTNKGPALKISSQGRNSKKRKMTRTTAMLVIISAIYILGFMPHLGLMFFKFFAMETVASLSMLEQSFYNLFLRTYFLNCAANPIVYSLCDRNFRRECISVFKCFSGRRL